MSTPSVETLRHGLDKLEQQKAELQAQISRKAGLLREKERKQRTRQSIELGGLVRIAELHEVDAGLLLGLLLGAAKHYKTADHMAKMTWKEAGDRELADRAAKSSEKGKGQAKAQTPEMAPSGRQPVMYGNGSGSMDAIGRVEADADPIRL